MKKLIAILIIASSAAMASPVSWIFQVQEKVQGFNYGFARVETPLPLDSRVVSADYKNGILTLHAIIDPDARMVWRRIEITRGNHPSVWRDDQLIGESNGVLIWDAGEFEQPITMRYAKSPPTE